MPQRHRIFDEYEEEAPGAIFGAALNQIIHHHLTRNIMDPNMQNNMPDMSDGNSGSTQQEQLSQPERMTGNNTPAEINPNTPHPKEFDDQDTRHQREIDLPDWEQEQERKEEKGYAEEPKEEYIPEINGNDKYQKNYQDDEKPAVTE